MSRISTGRRDVPLATIPVAVTIVVLTYLTGKLAYRLLDVILIILVAATVGFGAPRATAVLAVLGYRIVNYWLPLIPGAIAYLRLRLRSATVGSREPWTPSAG